jgi:hypothetical protein
LAHPGAKKEFALRYRPYILEVQGDVFPEEQEDIFPARPSPREAFTSKYNTAETKGLSL